MFFLIIFTRKRYIQFYLEGLGARIEIQLLDYDSGDLHEVILFEWIIVLIFRVTLTLSFETFSRTRYTESANTAAGVSIESSLLFL